MQSDRVCAKASLVCALAGATILSLSAAGALATEGEFGGECVMGLALGKDIKTDCSVNTVYNGKTYCFGNETAREPEEAWRVPAQGAGLLFKQAAAVGSVIPA